MPTRPEPNTANIDSRGNRWYFSNSGQIVTPDTAGWELADEIVRLNIGDTTKEGEDVQIRTPPKSKLASAAVAQLTESSPLETGSIPSVDSSPSSDHQIVVSHSRGSSTDTTFSSQESGVSSNSNTMLVQPLKSGPMSELKERPHSFSGGLSSADLRRLQEAGENASPDNDSQQWSISSEQQQQQLSYPSLAPNGTNIQRPQPQQAYPSPPGNQHLNRDDAQPVVYSMQQQRSWADVPQPGIMPASPPYVQARPNNNIPPMPYRQPPRAFPQQGVLPNPGYGAPHHTAHLSLGNSQQLYDMMLPGVPPDNAHPAVSRVQQQHNVSPFRGAHHHSASDPSALRDAATLALLNNNMQAFNPGMFPGNVAVPHPAPPMQMYPGPFYGTQEAYRPDPAAAAHAMANRIQPQYTGPYGIVPSQQQIDGGMSSPASTTGGSGPSANNRKLGLYKTELCRSWEEKGSCRYGTKCQFAHGEDELRKVARHPKYKTEICRTFWVSGSCPYGKRCCFIHTELPSSAAAAGGAPADNIPPPPSRPDGRARSMSTNSDPNDASGSLLARISAKRSHETSTNSSATPVDTPSGGFQFTRPPTGALRVDTSGLDTSAIKHQNKSAYPSFANNGVLLPAQEHITAKSPAPVTAGPDLGRHNNSRLEIVGFQVVKAGTPPTGRHVPSGSEDLSGYPTGNYEPTSGPSAVNGHGHVRAGSAGNWATFSRNMSAYPHAPSPVGENNVNSPWSTTELMGPRLNEKAWA
ncbi:hypothetical protein K435DRAFT_646085 [Dendrothele bispora CBS 962.96]|uniref:C3H1-type domain-containing protein n=1 Tax=Dendrothele bispora (strain CBS 962.96) TaxID=1314807 RepID=A0A4V4HIC1_DENBC|nr:hypothetical protein K435DRAFT_646085 [Dendrothele bispora CBS 962.96]